VNGKPNPKKGDFMANKTPGFITGANAKIRLDGVTVAYAMDVSYNVDTLTVPVECMGRYEVLSNEPIAYGCNGTLSIIRYTKQAKASNIDGASASGTAASNIGGTNIKFGDHIDPSKMLTSKTFDLEIYQKLNQTAGAGASDVASVYRIKDCRLVRRGATLNKRGVLVDTYAFVGVVAEDSDGASVGTSGEEDLK
jgi:hypothetical protein